MKALIKYIAQALVDHPEQVTVPTLEGNQTSVLVKECQPGGKYAEYTYCR